MRRLAISLPLFLLSAVLMTLNFDILWRYFAWFNQTLSIFTLWAVTVWLARKGKMYWVSLVPAVFMTAVCTSYIMVAPEGFGVSYTISCLSGVVLAVLLLGLFVRWRMRLDAANVAVKGIPEKSRLDKGE